MALNVVAIMGRLTKDPELKTSQSGASWLGIQVTVDRSYTKQGEEKKCDFIPVSIFGKTAEFVAKYFKKGSMIVITGRIEMEEYTDKEGNKRTGFKVVANECSFAGSKKDNEQTETNTTPNYEEIPEDNLPFSL